MAGYDQPHATHDMILRFMGMNFSAITDGTARVPSSVGDDEKPSFIESKPASAAPAPPTTKTPEQDKAMWEGTTNIYFPALRTWPHSYVAYYNAGSAAIVLVLIVAALGTVFWCRVRKQRLQGLPTSRNEEEYIPLTQDLPNTSDPPDNREFRARKGKERAQETGSPPLFDVGDSDEDDDSHTQ
jgi:carboxypeptidase D